MPSKEPVPTGDNLRVLWLFACHNWSLPAHALKAETYQLNPRARISELRQRYGLRIIATWVIVNGRKHTTYTLHLASRDHARKLLKLAAEAEKKSPKKSISA